MGPSQTQKLCTAQETTTKWKDNIQNGIKMSANKATNKGLISKIYKQLCSLIKKKKSKDG